ncbi:MAG: hypothetical protein O3C28_17000, partial [Proteobacteria bacterium]|nr:hypothetical protein [Pseudomonadota bacterium]
MSERGFDVHCLRGGLLKYGMLGAVEQTDEEPGLANLDLDDLTVIPDAARKSSITVSAVVPSSHRSEIEQPRERRRASNNDDVVDSEIRAQALKAELGKANIKLEEARQYTEQAEKEHRKTIDAEKIKWDEEREQLTAQALKAKRQANEAEVLKKELAKAKQETQRQAAELEKKRS